MALHTSSTRRVRVGAFHVDLESGELLNNGTRVRLQVQSLELLKALLERPGMMVGREELRQRLWPNDTFVDFDHGLNAAVRRLREALGDSADSPRFVETIPRKGYRLVAPTDVTIPGPADSPSVGNEHEPSADTAAPHRPPGGRWLYITMAIGISLTLAAGAWRACPSTSSAGRPTVATLSVDLPVDWSIQSLDHVALSPDSRYIAFTAVGPDHRGSLWLRPLTGSARQMPRTEGAVAPFWSPDSARIGFFANGNLKAVTVADGRVQVFGATAPAPVVGGAAAWLTSGDILFMPLSSSLGTPVRAARLRRLNPATGAVETIGTPSTEQRDYIDHVAPHPIPGGNAFTFVRWNPSTLDMTGHVGEIGTSRVMDLGQTDSRIEVTATGHAVFVRKGTLVAQQFDIAARRLLGAPVALAQDVAVYQPMLGHFAAGPDMIAYMPRQAMTSGIQMTLFDRGGTPIRTISDVAEYSAARVSPDGTRLAVGRRDPIRGTRDIWVHDLSGKSPPIQLTFDSRDDMSPSWSADGRTILFTSDRSGERDIYRIAVGAGRPEVPAFSSPDSKSLNAWSADEGFLVYDTGARGSIDPQGRINKDLFVVALNGIPRVRPLAATQAAESHADISPDGTLVAYQSSGASGSALFVATFPENDRQFPVPGGGTEPMWRADGRELFFISPRDELCAVDVTSVGGAVRFGSPHVLFSPQNVPSTFRRYAPLPDGQSFVVLTASSPRSSQTMTVLVNWRSVLQD